MELGGDEMYLSIKSIQQQWENNVRSSTAELSRDVFK